MKFVGHCPSQVNQRHYRCDKVDYQFDYFHYFGGHFLPRNKRGKGGSRQPIATPLKEAI